MRFLLLLAIIMPANIFAAAFAFSGDWRAEVAMYHKLDLNGAMHGTGTTDYTDPASPDYNPNYDQDSTKTYWLQRFKIRPDLIVYDNVRIKNEWILLAGSALPSTNMGGAIDNFVAGGLTGADNVHAQISIRRVWLDWASDWGVFTMGRQPQNFGLGMTYNSGDGVWDYYGDSVDRIAYKLVMGTVYFKIGYDILAEGAVNYAQDDQSAFITELGYSEPESNMDMAFLWHFYFAPGRQRVHTYDVFQKKVFPVSALSIAWEAAYQKGTMGASTVQSFGMLVDFAWKPSPIEFGLKTGFATGDNDGADGKYYAFHYNRNYKIAFLLFTEDLGVGGDSVHGSQGIGADFNDLGAVFFAPYMGWNLTDSLKLSSVVAYALTQKRPTTGRAKNLGTELDLDLTYTWKEDLDTGIRAGWFFPSSYFVGRAVGMGLMATVSLKF
ncbi:MAG: hypothetical protein V1647_06460 [Pseudomonadota bacterium]